MPYYSEKELNELGFKSVGKNVKVSTKSSIYDHEKIEIGDNSRIDDYCVISGNIKIGKNVHITPMCLIAGGEKGIIFCDFTTVSYGVKIFTQSDDYSGDTMTNSTIPKAFKNECKKAITIKSHSIIGAGAIIMPGVTLDEGTSIGAMSLVSKSTEPWGIYAGSPARRIKEKSRLLLKLKDRYLESECKNDSV